MFNIYVVVIQAQRNAQDKNEAAAFRDEEPHIEEQIEQNNEKTQSLQCALEASVSTESDGTEQLIGNVLEQLSIRTKLWLLLSKGIWFLLGIIIVTIVGIVNYTESEELGIFNCTNTISGNYSF